MQTPSDMAVEPHTLHSSLRHFPQVAATSSHDLSFRPDVDPKFALLQLASGAPSLRADPQLSWSRQDWSAACAAVPQKETPLLHIHLVSSNDFR
jgi:hypothetical protein